MLSKGSLSTLGWLFILFLMVGGTLFWGQHLVIAQQISEMENEHIQKLVENRDRAMNDVTVAKETLDRANMACNEALSLYEIMVSKYKYSLELIKLYTKGI